MSRPRRVEKKESVIVREICEWLEAEDYFFWRSNNIAAPQIGARGDIRFRSLPKFALKGLPDILVLKGGLLIGLEVKSAKGILRTEQYAFGQNMLMHGGRYGVVHSVEEARHIVEL